ncbi:MAG: PAS domain S-box protein, partial [Smithella sp.]
MKNKGDENRKRNKELHNSTVTSKKSKGTTRDSSKRFQIIFEAVEEGIAIHDNGVIIEANQVLARMFGYELPELIGMKAEKLATPESWEIIKKNIFTKYDKPYEGLAVRKDSSTFICSLAGKPYKYKGKTLRLATFIDMTNRKNKENKLMKSELFFREITEHSSDIIIIIDKQGT